jgi:GNAT superfamily N-acetyltransferase
MSSVGEFHRSSSRSTRDRAPIVTSEQERRNTVSPVASHSPEVACASPVILDAHRDAATCPADQGDEYRSAMGSQLRVRSARVDDAAEMARVNVQSWRETYRGLMADDVLDDPELPGMRERFWTDILTDERSRANRVAVAERGGEMIGIAMAAPTEGADTRWAMRLYVLYVVAVEHGSGAGSVLLDAVIAPQDSALLWVADPNPRAQAFYRRHGFASDGNVSVEAGVRAIRMVRTADPDPRA